MITFTERSLYLVFDRASGRLVGSVGMHRPDWVLPERCGFVLEGVHRNAYRSALGELRNTCVYAKIPA